MRFEVIKDWKRSWKFASVQWSVVGILCMGLDIANQVWQALPPRVLDSIPNSSLIAIILFLFSLVGRLTKLKEKPDGPE